MKLPERQIAGFLLIGLQACGGDTSHRGSSTGELALDPVPVLVIGADESRADQQLFRISDVAPSPRGLMVADRGNSQVLVFDSAGGLLFTVGGRGGGPQEFQAVSSIGRWDASHFYTFDAFAQRVVVWSDSGEYVRAVPLYHEGAAQFARRRDDGGYMMAVAKSAAMPRTIGQRAVDSVLVVPFDSTGSAQDPMWRLPLRQQTAIASPEGRTRITLIPFDPEGVLWLGEKRAYYGWPADSIILRLTYETGAVDTLTVPLAATPLAPEIIQAWTSSRLGEANPENRQRMDAYYRTIPFPANVPRYDRIIEDERGRLWFRRYALPEDSISRWLVRSEDGQQYHHLTAPAKLDPKHISVLTLTAILQDELDRHLVAQFRLGPPQ